MIVAVLSGRIRAIVVIVTPHHRMIVVMLFRLLFVMLFRMILRTKGHRNHRGQRKGRNSENNRFPSLMTHGHFPFDVPKKGDYERRQSRRKYRHESLNVSVGLHQPARRQPAARSPRSRLPRFPVRIQPPPGRRHNLRPRALRAA